MKKIRLLILTLISVLLLSACGQVAEKTGPKYVNQDGSIRIGAEGAMDIETPEEELADVTIDFFYDAACPGCTLYMSHTNQTLKEEISAGNVNVVIRPLTFLNDQTPDDYSKRAAAYMLAVGEYAPEKAWNFFVRLLSEDFVPENPVTDYTPDSKFIQVMENIGITEEQIEDIEEHKEEYLSLAVATTESFTAPNSKWTRYANDDGVYIPFILVNKTGTHVNKAIDLSNTEKGLNAHLRELIDEASKQ